MPQTFPEIFYLFFTYPNNFPATIPPVNHLSHPRNKTVTDPHGLPRLREISRLPTAVPSSVQLTYHKKKTKNKSNTLSRTIYFTFGLPNTYHAVPCVKVHVKLKNIYIS